MKGFSYVARAVAWRSIRRMFSSPALLLPTVIPPLFVLIAFAGGLSKLSGVRDFGYLRCPELSGQSSIRMMSGKVLF
jgi:hypothetical protein